MSSNTTVGITITAKDNATKVLARFGTSVEKMKRQAKQASVAIGAMGVAVGGLAVKEAVAFDKSMGNLETLLGNDTVALGKFDKGMKDILKTVPVNPDELGASAYAVVSSGITDTAQALDVLNSSAKLGVAGLGSTESATTLMTLAMNNFKDSGLSSDDVANLLFKTVKNGVTTIDQMSQSFGLVAPLAQSAGISLEELQAATSALTIGNKSASMSQNSIKAGLVSLGKPTADAIALFDKLGVKTFPELIKKTGGMVNAFQAMKDASAGNEAQFNGAIGSGDALTSVISLLGEQSDSYNRILGDMQSGTNDMTVAYEAQRERAWATFQVLKNNLSIALGELGNVILPTLVEVSKIMIEKLKQFSTWFGSLSDRTKKMVIVGAILIPILIGLAVVLAPIITIIGGIVAVVGFLIPLVVSMSRAFLAVLPILLPIIAVLTALGLAGIQLVRIYKLVKNDWDLIWLGIKVSFAEAWQSMKGLMVSVGDFILGKIDWIMTGLQDVLAFIDKVINKAKEIGGKAISRVKNVLSVNDAVISPSGQVITTNPKDYIIATQNPASLGGGGGVTINMSGNQFLGGRDIAEQIGNDIINIIKREQRVS